MNRLSIVFTIGILLCLLGCRNSRESLPVSIKYQGVINPMAEFYLDDQLKPVSPCPSQGVITNQKDYDLFVGRIPAKVPFRTKGDDHPNDDPLYKKPPIDFTKQMMIMVVQKASMYRSPDITSVALSDESLQVTYIMPDLQQYAGAQENGNGTYCAVVVPRHDGPVRFTEKKSETTQQETERDK
jgi:hypothetical protein